MTSTEILRISYKTCFICLLKLVFRLFFCGSRKNCANAQASTEKHFRKRNFNRTRSFFRAIHKPQWMVMVHEVFIRSVASFSSETQKQAEKKLWNIGISIKSK